MNKSDPKILDMYYSANIIKDTEIDLYESSQKIKISNKIDSFESVKFSQIKINELFGTKTRVMYFNPPIGPLPPGSQCSYINCGKIGPIATENKDVYHEKNCETPVKEYLIMSDEGKKKHSSKIEKHFEDQEIPEIIPYLSIFPKRGLQTSSVSKSKKVTLDNLITLSYKTRPVSNKALFSRDHSSFNIIVRLNKTSSIYITSAPYSLTEYNIENLGSRIIGILRKDLSIDIKDNVENSWITSLKGNYNVLSDYTYTLDLHNLNGIIKNHITRKGSLSIKQEDNKEKKYSISNYKFLFNLSLISFTLNVGTIKAYVEIRVRGNVKILISNGSIYNKIDSDQLIKVAKFLKPLFIENESVLLVKTEAEILKENKIHNIIKPLEYKRNTEIQPQICTGPTRSKPFPYSFKGICPKKNEGMNDEGISWTTADKVRPMRVYDFYEPCCKKITGEYELPVRFYDPRKNDNIDNVFKQIILGNNINHDDLIINSTGEKKIFLRRLIYGFPNNIAKKKPELFDSDKDIDSHTKYGIEYDEKLGYIDNKAATAVPGTPGKRESRVYKGLKELLTTDKDDTIEHIVKCYYSDYKETDMFVNDTIPKLAPIMVLTSKDYIDSFVMMEIPENGIYTKLVILKNGTVYIVEDTRKGSNIIWGPEFINVDYDFNLVISGIWKDNSFYPIDILSASPEKNLPSLFYLVTKETIGSTNRNLVMSEYTEYLVENLSQFFDVVPVKAMMATDTNIERIIEHSISCVFISSDKKYTNTSFFTWSTGIEQNYMDVLVFDFQIVNTDEFKGTCDVRSEGKLLEKVSKIYVGKKIASKLKQNKYYQFTLDYEFTPSGIKKITTILKIPSFDIVNKEPLGEHDTFEETQYKILIAFDPLERPLLKK
jgi:hypothetical protein